MPDRATIISNLLDRIAIDPVSGCWEWQSTKNWKGYGRMYVGSHREQAHRVSYEVFVGPIPPGLVIDHLCRNVGCVNPEHLEPVTPRQNTVDRGVGNLAAQRARMSHCVNGHPLSGDRGNRRCRKCRTDREAKRHRSRRDQTHGAPPP